MDRDKGYFMIKPDSMICQMCGQEKDVIALTFKFIGTSGHCVFMCMSCLSELKTEIEMAENFFKKYF